MVDEIAEKSADVFILFDRSGSMADRLSDAQGGYDAFIKAQKDADGLRNICLWDFDTEHRLVYGLTEVSKIPERSYTLQPRGSTALLDAITRLIAYAETHRDSSNQTFIVIQTDGYENASTEATGPSVKALVERKIADGWQFIYLGANQDAIAVARDYGIPVANAATFDMSRAVATSGGVAAMMSVGLKGGPYGFTGQQRQSFTDTAPATIWVGDLNVSEYDQEPLVKFE